MEDNEKRNTPSQDFGPRLEVAARSIISPKQNTLPENQDNYLMIDSKGLVRYMLDHKDHYEQVESWQTGHIRLAVMDGIGGHGDGRQVVESVAKGIADIPPCFDHQALDCALERLHEKLQQTFHQENKIPGCTLTLLEIPAEGPALLFHVGDSRFYRIDEAGSHYQTIDHVPASSFALNNQMGEEEWFKQVHEETRSIISQAFVMGNNLNGGVNLEKGLITLEPAQLPDFLKDKADRREVALQAEEVYLFGTDGLWAQSKPQAFIQRWPKLLIQPERELSPLLDDLFVELIMSCEEEQHLDNSTAVVLRVKQ